MSDLSNEISSYSTQRSCECYKKLQTYGIPLYINEENDLYGESQKKITFQKAFELPGTLKINQSITQYPVIEDTELSTVFHQMALVIPNLSDFEQNLLSFWILDVFIEGLWTAQNKKMDFDNQKATLLWIAYVFNYIQRENPTRKSLFHHLKLILFNIECKKKNSEYSDERTGESKQEISDVTEIGQDGSVTWKDQEIWKLPLPPNAEENRIDEYDESQTSTSAEEQEEEDSTQNELSEEVKDSSSATPERNDIANTSLKNLSDMKVILDILYQIFGRCWVYLEIQTVFHSMPPTQQVDLPFTLKVPKLVMKPDTSTMLRSERFGRRPSYSDKPFEDEDSEMQLHKNDFILPLQVAEESKIIMKQYFPQPSSQRSILGRKKT